MVNERYICSHSTVRVISSDMSKQDRLKSETSLPAKKSSETELEIINSITEIPPVVMEFIRPAKPTESGEAVPEAILNLQELFLKETFVRFLYLLILILQKGDVLLIYSFMAGSKSLSGF